ncbi:2,3-bisphosphoglycerate-independent phosphoglycerate mutase [Paracoccus suum]|uniref:2,3-bisphosphoglycerate-independent phosphoglycerate mutase n=1 Tax=Paracoccus suum TaxID=2259340 RepID=A0A344PGL5_9RHOB|nr:2,3-bisphosphoglycerate-independent phosphoglycerate mutase [Paracoccus suum]AXC48520.1 2,3-bisphosphoglycerate-independent phosphoglycerate mutase [Paracoccus suum]
MTPTPAHPRPVMLCILDGWGIGAIPEYSAPAQADTPVMDRLLAQDPHATLTTFGPDVGLPRGQMGNSEVGHTNIGAGRVVAMDLGQIDLALEDGSFAANSALGAFVAALKASGGTAHLMGVASNGGVHGHIAHLIGAARAIVEAGVPVIIHAITDGRDVPPSSALGFVTELAGALPEGARIGTVIGRYWAMDRDNRWERIARATDAILHGKGTPAPDGPTAVADAHAAGTTDEFIEPAVIAGYTGPRDGDGFFCLNFRADRAREIMAALAAPDFTAFDPGRRPAWAAVMGMADYSALHDLYMSAMYPKRQITNTLGAWVASHGLRQIRIAETEKYPHVTFFLNGGREAPEVGEDRVMRPSPKVATYDLAPEMAAEEVTESVVDAITQGDYDLIVVNFANPDMVGHTGSLPAAIRACAAVDSGLGRIIAALDAARGAAVICADHGNCELMVDPATGGPHTAHTLNPVPVIVHGGPAGTHLRDGRLADLAPTVLDLMGLAPPPEMTGTSLIQREGMA